MSSRRGARSRVKKRPPQQVTLLRSSPVRAPSPPAPAPAVSKQKKRQAPNKKGSSGSRKEAPRLMDAPMKLVKRSLKFAPPSALQSLASDNTEFRVVGALGCASSGKSTLLSLLAGWMPGSEAPRPFALGCTRGIDVFVVPELRLILLDTQACLSTKLPHGDAGSLRVGLFLMAVCNSVLFVQRGDEPDAHFLHWTRSLMMLAERLQAHALPSTIYVFNATGDTSWEHAQRVEKLTAGVPCCFLPRFGAHFESHAELFRRLWAVQRTPPRRPLSQREWVQSCSKVWQSLASPAVVDQFLKCL